MALPTVAGSRSHRALTRAQRAFTLIELIVVLAIVALLTTLALPRYFQTLDVSKETVLRENLRTIS